MDWLTELPGGGDMESMDAADMFRDIGEPGTYNITAQHDVGTRHSSIYSLAVLMAIFQVDLG